LKANVLCKSLNEYVQIKSFDKDKLSYQCKMLSIKNQENDKEDVREIVQDELTKIIEI
jgi:membrane-bound inhibitor of C-type lysozyme